MSKPPIPIDRRVEIYATADGDVRLDVPIDRETVWLSLSQMAELYGQPAAPGGGTSQ